MQRDELAGAIANGVHEWLRSDKCPLNIKMTMGNTSPLVEPIAAAVRAYANREDVVDRVAAFLWGHDTGEQWAELDAAGQADYRDTAIAAINAMLGVGDAE